MKSLVRCILPCLICSHLLVPCVLVQAAVSNTSSTQAITQGWDGFSADFDPFWSGVTDRVNWSRYGDGGPTYGYVQIVPPPHPMFPASPVKAVELLSSSRSVKATSVSRIWVPGDTGIAENSDSESTEKSGIWNETLANYAQVIDLDDFVLGRAESLSSLDSHVNDSIYSLTARQQATTSIDPILATLFPKPFPKSPTNTTYLTSDSEVSAVAETNFSAAYQVNHQASFRLYGLFGGEGELDVRFSLTDRETGEVYFEQALSSYGQQGEQIEFFFSGDFSPGIYDLSFSSTSQNILTPMGTLNPGGLGEFAIDFAAQPIGPWETSPSDFDGNGSTNSHDLQAWKQSFGKIAKADLNDDGLLIYEEYDAWIDQAEEQNLSHNKAQAFKFADPDDVGDFHLEYSDSAVSLSGDADGDLDADGNDFLLWQRTLTPDPLAAWHGSFGTGRANGDLDTDGDTDGNDFLQWQRQPNGAQTRTLSAVPEPPALLLTLMAATICCCLRASG